jgi:uncharacterized protein DUF6049
MACQRYHRQPAVTRRCLRLAALAIAAGAAGIMTVPAAASTAGPAAAARHDPDRQRPWIAITGMTPGYAQPTGKVMVSGIVANPSGSPLRNASVQILSTLTPLTSQQMASYLTAQQPGIDEDINGASRNLPALVPAHGTAPWTMTLTAHQLGMTTFGVYPVTAQLKTTDTTLGTITSLGYASTFLPFWPGKAAAKTEKKVSIAWVWPLIDVPQQTICGTLTSNELAGSVATGGRLNGLLAAGETATAQQAQLTWAIDPALLSDLQAMSRPYRVTGTGTCAGGKLEPADKAAGTWLANLQGVAARQDFFTTPYADVDVAALALAHGGMSSELAAAFADGGQAASRAKVPGTQKKILGRAQRVTPDTVGPIAWPAGGIASYGVVEAVAKNKIGTVILSSSLIHTPATVTKVPNGEGGEMNALLANSTLTKILSGRRDGIPGLVPDQYAAPPGARAEVREAAAFAKEQWFRAETAMIAAEAPAAGRAVIVAPPRRWNPLPGMAGALLADTVTSPWLQPTTLASLASANSAAGRVSPKLPGENRVTRGELNGSLLQGIRKLSQQVQLLDSILPTSGHGYLSTAVDTAESSAWRGGRANQRYAERLVRRDLAYVGVRLHQIKILISDRVTLGGQNGIVPVSVSNGLGQPVRVKLVASAPAADHVTVGKASNVFTDVITVQGHTQRVIKLPVTAAQAGSTVLTLRLESAGGTPLPERAAPLTVVATHFGTLAIVIISIALVVFVLTATARAIRRGGPQDGASAAEAEELDAMPSTRDPASADGETDTVVPGEVEDRQAAKEADEHASAPGTADRS